MRYHSPIKCEPQPDHSNNKRGNVRVDIFHLDVHMVHDVVYMKTSIQTTNLWIKYKYNGLSLDL